MSIPVDGLPLTAAISPRVQVVERTGSTNADVARHVADDPEGWPHLSLLVTTDQEEGRGRLDRQWTAPPGSALALSVVVRVPGLPVAQRGWIPLIAGAAMTQAIAAAFADSDDDVELKWPNDVLVDGYKICGILAEVVPAHPDTVVVGSGVNTRMTADQLPVPTATSFAVRGVAVDDDRLISDYLSAFDRMLSALLRDGDASVAGVRAEVEGLCGTIGAAVRVSLPDGSTLDGRAERIDEDGRLVVVDRVGLVTEVSAGDVVHVR